MNEYPASNEQLANVYDPRYRQIIIVYPLLWKHEINGNWYVSHIIPIDKL